MQPVIYTATGIFFDLANPKPEDVHLSDIGKALNNIQRFTGHARHGKPWSVARHSLVVGRIVADLVGSDHRKMIRTALLHDATEAYVGDCSTPMKEAMRRLTGNASPFDTIERNVWWAIAKKFDLYQEMPEIVKHADAVALGMEADRIFGAGTSDDWGLPKHDMSFVPVTGFTKLAASYLD